MQRMSVVSSELGICAFEGRITVGLWLLDPREERIVSESASSQRAEPWCRKQESLLTRYDVPFCSGCAVTSSLILQSLASA